MAVITVIKQRNSPAATWASVNPVLALGEVGYETDTGKSKTGNGTSTWTALSYGNAGGAIPQSQVTNLTTDLAAKQATVTGAATTILFSDLTTGRALTSNGTGKVTVSATTDTELGYLSGTTSSVQTQINGKAATSHTHTFSTLTDFNVTSPVNGQSLTYDSASSKWINSAAAATGETISSFLLMGA